MAKRTDHNLQNTKRRGKVFANGKQRRVKRLVRKRETSNKKFVTVDYLQSLFYNLPMGYKISCSHSGKAFLEQNTHSKLTINCQEDQPKKDDASKRIFGRKGARYLPPRAVVPRWQRVVRRKCARCCWTPTIVPRQKLLTEEEALFREVFFG